MRAHDVRNLRACPSCHWLGHKRNFVRDERLCIRCALAEAGTLEQFLASHPREDWEKLPLSLIGADGMRQVIAALDAAGKE